ncbi:nagb/rpia/CoA transferase-like protein [Xylariomycetidae sp. FL2044]|nr:nagb/rpia/CoA transferase-like protein [Xylariomycetidae sp. FL2044]
MSAAKEGSLSEAQPAPPAAATPEKEQTPTTNAQKENKPKADTKEADGTAPKLTNAQLKQQAKAAKAARRAQQKESKETAKGEAAVSSAPGQLGPSASEVKGIKGKGKQEASAMAGSGLATRTVASKWAAPSPPLEPKVTIPECFSHLSMAKRLPMTQADKDVHPTVLALGQQMATFAIDESITRLKATLLAFKKVIDSYTTPPGNTLARHLTPHVLNPQIDYLTACRPMCFAMGNAIRWLKLQVSKIDPDVAEQDAKKQLCAGIDNFIQERISVAGLVITEKAAEQIHNGDTVLTYGRSTSVERALVHAATLDQKKFSVIIIDDPYDKRGQALAKELTTEGIRVSYCGDFGGLRWHVQRASKIILAAESMFNNGSMYSKSGTCDVALTAMDVGIPVLTLCETINITERVSTDSLTYNEIDPERCTAETFRLLYDTTPDRFLSIVITELGSVQPTSVPDLLRKLEESN